jgi:hypothetical protein
MINLSGWVDHFYVDGVYADGAVGGVIPNDVSYPVDGWLYVNAYNTSISNSRFTNMWVECLIFEHPPSDLINVNSFIQPAVGDTVTLTVQANQLNWNEELKANKLYTIRDKQNAPSFKEWAVGVYQATSWQTPITIGSTITFTRVSDDYVLKPEPSLPIVGQFSAAGTVTSNDCSIVMFEEGGPSSATVNSCHFSMDKPITRQDGSHKITKAIKITNAGTGYTSVPTVTISGNQGTVATASISQGQVSGISLQNGVFFYLNLPTVTITGGGGSGATAVVEFTDLRFAPCIKSSASAIISGCTFRNFNTALILNPEFGLQGGPMIIQGCIFHGQKNGVNGVPMAPHIVFSVVPDNIVCNNVFMQDDVSSYLTALVIGRSGISVTNNNFKLQREAEQGQNRSAIEIVNASGYDNPWQMNIADNTFYGYNHAVSGNVSTTLGVINGELVDKPIKIDPLGMSRGTTQKWAGPNGEIWTIGLTNDGEIEVRK